jgi:ABC-2 type transport system ATP-binding protein
MNEPKQLVEAVGLTMRFRGARQALGAPRPELVALDDVDLTLHEGEVFGLVGPNGAGKTTLIKCLTTLLVPSAGRARVAGMDVVRDAAQVRRTIGLVTSNERSFYWRLSGRENLRFFASLYDLSSRESGPWIEELLDLLDLRKAADRRFDDLSTGLRQRFAFARGLLGRPLVLFLDEPTKGVDPVGRAEMLVLIRDRILARWRPTILITSHDLAEIQALCGRIALLDHGRVLACGTLAELREIARPVDRVDLLIRGVPVVRLRALAAAASADSVVVPSNGALAVTLAVPQGPAGSEGLARFVRAIVHERGDVLACSSERGSLHDVFHALLARRGRT